MCNMLAVGIVLYVQGDTTGLLTGSLGTDNESGLIPYLGSSSAEEECNCPATWGTAVAGRHMSVSKHSDKFNKMTAYKK